jgi:hypothetical protein
MSVNFMTFFGLRENFTLDELRNAKNSKLNSLANTKLSEEDKQVYALEIIRLYKKAKRQISQNHNNFSLIPLNNSNSFFNNVINHMQQFNFNNLQNTLTNITSQSRSYNERMLSDGSKIVMEVNKTNNNGTIKEEIKSYKILPNGTRQEINYNDAVKAITNTTTK